MPLMAEAALDGGPDEAAEQDGAGGTHPDLGHQVLGMIVPVGDQNAGAEQHHRRQRDRGDHRADLVDEAPVEPAAVDASRGHHGDHRRDEEQDHPRGRVLAVRSSRPPQHQQHGDSGGQDVDADGDRRAERVLTDQRGEASRGTPAGRVERSRHR